MENQSSSPASPNLVLWVIWFALTSAVVTYLVVLVLIGSSSESGEENLSFLTNILSAVGLVFLLVSFTVRKKVTLPAAKSQSPDKFGRIMTSCIISWALAESVAIFGLLLGLQGAPMSSCGLFFLASFAAMVFLTPGFAPLKNLIKVLPDED